MPASGSKPVPPLMTDSRGPNPRAAPLPPRAQPLPRTPLSRCRGARRKDIVRSRHHRANDHAAAGRGRDQRVSPRSRRGRYVKRRRLPARRARRASVRAYRRRPFYHSRPAAAAVTSIPAQRAAARRMNAIPVTAENGDAKVIILGLTGSIGVGKATTAKHVVDDGVPGYDADAAVHKIYEGEAGPAIEAAFTATAAGGKAHLNNLSA